MNRRIEDSSIKHQASNTKHSISSPQSLPSKRSSFIWACRDQVVQLGPRTLIMGILNVTPDSFFDGGNYFTLDQAIQRGLTMVKEGADIIDVGGESTQPDSVRISVQEELKRVIPVVRELVKQGNTLISVDTMKADVAREAVREGAHIINDISGLTFDPEMVELVCQSRVGVLIVHMQGQPENMQQNPTYEDVISEVHEYLLSRVAVLVKKGVALNRIAIDPGIGFGKTVEHNLKLLMAVNRFTCQRPIVVGLSRKRFLGTLTHRSTDERLSASLGAAAYAIGRGAHVLRVHDVQETGDVAKVVDRLLKEEYNGTGMEPDPCD